MTVPKNDTSGKRSVQLEVEVPGTPEDVWRAIATGSGISAWFTPTEVEEREGGRIHFHLMNDWESTGVVTEWEPPRRFTYEERDWMPGAPALATEFTIEAKSGGTCSLRLVSSLFTSEADWDDQLESFEGGWSLFMQVLRIYLRDFPNQHVSFFQLTRNTTRSVDETWSTLTDALGVSGSVGARVESAAGKPILSGIIERQPDEARKEFVIRTDTPAPGFMLINAFSYANQVQASVSFYLFGPAAPAAAAENQPVWRTVMDTLFPGVETAKPTA
jgi:uncharacterized protein YndB with AHSA1/START domain